MLKDYIDYSSSIERSNLASNPLLRDGNKIKGREYDFNVEGTINLQLKRFLISETEKKLREAIGNVDNLLLFAQQLISSSTIISLQNQLDFTDIINSVKNSITKADSIMQWWTEKGDATALQVYHSDLEIMHILIISMLASVRQIHQGFSQGTDTLKSFEKLKEMIFQLEIQFQKTVNPTDGSQLLMPKTAATNAIATGKDFVQHSPNHFHVQNPENTVVLRKGELITLTRQSQNPIFQGDLAGQAIPQQLLKHTLPSIPTDGEDDHEEFRATKLQLSAHDIPLHQMLQKQLEPTVTTVKSCDKKTQIQNQPSTTQEIVSQELLLFLAHSIFELLEEESFQVVMETLCETFHHCQSFGPKQLLQPASSFSTSTNLSLPQSKACTSEPFSNETETFGFGCNALLAVKQITEEVVRTASSDIVQELQLTFPIQDSKHVHLSKMNVTSKAILSNQDHCAPFVLSESRAMVLATLKEQQEYIKVQAKKHPFKNCHIHSCHLVDRFSFSCCPKELSAHSYCSFHLHFYFNLTEIEVLKDPLLFSYCPGCTLACPCIECTYKLQEIAMQLQLMTMNSTFTKAVQEDLTIEAGPFANNSNIEDQHLNNETHPLKTRSHSVSFPLQDASSCVHSTERIPNNIFSAEPKVQPICEEPMPECPEKKNAPQEYFSEQHSKQPDCETSVGDSQGVCERLFGYSQGDAEKSEFVPMKSWKDEANQGVIPKPYTVIAVSQVPTLSKSPTQPEAVEMNRSQPKRNAIQIHQPKIPSENFPTKLQEVSVDSTFKSHLLQTAVHANSTFEAELVQNDSDYQDLNNGTRVLKTTSPSAISSLQGISSFVHSPQLLSNCVLPAQPKVQSRFRSNENKRTSLNLLQNTFPKEHSKRPGYDSFLGERLKDAERSKLFCYHDKSKKKKVDPNLFQKMFFPQVVPQASILSKHSTHNNVDEQDRHETKTKLTQFHQQTDPSGIIPKQKSANWSLFPRELGNYSTNKNTNQEVSEIPIECNKCTELKSSNRILEEQNTALLMLIRKEKLLVQGCASNIQALEKDLAKEKELSQTLRGTVEKKLNKESFIEVVDI